MSATSESFIKTTLNLFLTTLCCFGERSHTEGRTKITVEGYNFSQVWYRQVRLCVIV